MTTPSQHPSIHKIQTLHELFMNLLWLLEQRQWTHLPQPSTFSEDALNARFRNEQGLETLAFTCYDAVHKRQALLLPISDTKLNVKTAKTLFDADAVCHQGVQVIVGFTNGSLTAPAKAHFEDAGFTFEELAWSSVQVAPSILANISLQCTDPIEDLKKCKKYKLSKISPNDPVSKLLSLQPNDIIRVKTGFGVSWRWVG
jgi:hypothetical protein